MKQLVHRFITLIVPVLLGLIALQYLVFSVLSVRKEYNNIVLSTENNFPEITIEDTAWFRLYKEKTWLESRLNAAKSDSISLSVNLKDSLLQLELKGVVLMSTRIKNFKADRFFYELPANGYHVLFGKDVMAKNSSSTIKKVPLTVKKAPKDSLEYASQNQVPDTLPNQEVHWLMQLDNDIELRIEGTNPDSGEKQLRNMFWRKRDLDQITRNLGETLIFKTPEYKPVITVMVPNTDAKTIYRALPDKPAVNIRF